MDPKLSSKLSSLGHTSPGLQLAVQRELLKSLSKSEMLSFPLPGLSSMVEALLKQGLDFDASEAPVEVSVPHHGFSFTVMANSGMTVLDAALGDQVLGEYITGSCGGTMSCSTCHVYLTDRGEYEGSLGEGGEVDEAEMDMLDLAKGYREGSSRLGCQVKVRGGIRVTVPEEVTDYWT